MLRNTAESSTMSSLKGPSSTPVRYGKQHGPTSFQTPPLKLGSRSQNSLEWGREPTADMTNEQSMRAEDLRSLVLKLIVKVDNLTAQVVEQQQNNNSQNDVNLG
jgi:hypothetical protein